jgi:hypothetical protein
MLPHAPLPEPRALVATGHPDNEAAHDDKSVVGRALRVRSLSEVLRERFLRRLLQESQEASIVEAAADAMLTILQRGEEASKVALVRELIRQLPTPAPLSPVSEKQPTVIAVQVNANLRRGRREFGR